MININKRGIIHKRKDRAFGYGEAQIIKDESQVSPVIQIVTKTRIRKYLGSRYENAPSREIKKWFELRRI